MRYRKYKLKVFKKTNLVKKYLKENKSKKI